MISSKLSYTLSMDTCTENFIVTLYNGSMHYQKIGSQLKDGINMALSLVDDFLLETKLSLSDCSHLAFVSGPGSFTGLRIGAAIIQALSISNNLPIISISKLQLLSMQVATKFNQKKVIVCLNALREEFFCGMYSFSEKTQLMEPDNGDRVYTKKKMLEVLSFAPKEYCVISDSIESLHDELHKNRDVFRLDEIATDHIIFSKLVYQQKELGNILPIGYAVPSYLKEPHINISKKSS